MSVWVVLDGCKMQVAKCVAGGNLMLSHAITFGQKEISSTSAQDLFLSCHWKQRAVLLDIHMNSAGQSRTETKALGGKATSPGQDIKRLPIKASSTQQLDGKGPFPSKRSAGFGLMFQNIQ